MMSSDAAWLWGLLLVWILLQKFVFPRLGVPTCGAPGPAGGGTSCSTRTKTDSPDARKET